MKPSQIPSLPQHSSRLFLRRENCHHAPTLLGVSLGQTLDMRYKTGYCQTSPVEPHRFWAPFKHVSGEPHIFGFQVQFVILSLMSRKKFLCISIYMKYFLVRHVLPRLLNPSLLVDQGWRCQESPRYLVFNYSL